jgi:heme-degrading monooxygenase HmoA
MWVIITHAKLKTGAEPEWDVAMRERLAGVRGHRGWLGAQILIPAEALDRRVIVGHWQTRADWEAWHESQEFMATRDRLNGLEAAPREESWYEVVLDVRPGAEASRQAA